MAYIGNAPGSIRQGRRAVYEFTSTANQTAFSGTDENGLTLDLLQANDNDVYLNGVRLIITDDYTVSGDVLTLVSGAAAGDKLIIMTQDEIANDASYSKAASDSRYINYDGDIVNGTIQMGGSGNNITFADNNKAIFGDNNDLQIYHDGNDKIVSSSSYFILEGSNIILRNNGGTEDYAKFFGNGAVNLYHDNSLKLATTSSGIDVTGTVTADAASLNNDAASFLISSADLSRYQRFRRNASNSLILDKYNGSTTTNTAKFDENGDILFYEATGTTPKFFWDASAESLGIGTTSPASTLDIKTGTGNLQLGVVGSASGQVIATNTLRLGAGAATSDPIQFYTSGSERMRLDASGNLLVGGTEANPASGNVAGVRLSSANSQFSADGATPVYVNRKTNDGTIVDFRKDGATVGSIGVSNSNNLYIYGAAANHSGLNFGTSQILPARDSATQDATVDLGSSTTRFKDLYLSGGVYLGGTGAANKLDDYEEGTWTPVLSGITPTTATGTYTKIGNLCYVGIFLNLGSQSSTGSAQVSNFPFEVVDDNDARAGLTLSYSTYATPLTFLLNDATQFGYLRSYGGSIQTWNTLSGKVFHIGGVYQTS